MSWLKTFTLSLEVICAAVETLYQFGCSEDIKETQVGVLPFSPYKCPTHSLVIRNVGEQNVSFHAVVQKTALLAECFHVY